jgi:hypothetical protein
LNLGQKVCQAFEVLLDPGDVENIQHEWGFVDLLHDSQEFGVDVLEPGALNGQEVFDVGTTGKDTLETCSV